MGEILLQNTLTNRKEVFTPLHSGEVRMYTCGPTVYDYAHIGNYRTFVFQDILRRFLRSRGLHMNHVMNLTDVDDRIIQNAAEKGISIFDYTAQYIQAFKEDMNALSCQTPEHLLRATDHIADMVKLIQSLEAKRMTYRSDGSIYYRIAKFPAYGELSKVDLSGIKAGARVETDRYEKDDARDFALWKAPKPGEHFWDTDIGPGRPGWHIECSAMAMKYLGDTLDIHTGGIDLVFPHHENEIAQSEAATSHPFVRYWLHAEHLIIDGEKMSKSLGNFYTLRDLFKKGHKPSTVRYLLASVPYRRQLNFTADSIQQAASSVERLRNFVARLKEEKFPAGSNAAMKIRAEQAIEDFEAGLADDLNTAEALAAIFDLVRDVNTAIDRGEFRQQDAPHALAAMKKFEEIFAVVEDNDGAKLHALGFASSGEEMTAEQIDALVAGRQKARERRDFQRADEIRKELAERGILLEDTRDGGVRWKKK